MSLSHDSVTYITLNYRVPYCFKKSFFMYLCFVLVVKYASMYVAYELTLMTEQLLIVLEKSKQETAKFVIRCVHAGLYVHFGIHFVWNMSSHSALHEVNMPINY